MDAARSILQRLTEAAGWVRFSSRHSDILWLPVASITRRRWFVSGIRMLKLMNVSARTADTDLSDVTTEALSEVDSI
jgi:hypothetical protein